MKSYQKGFDSNGEWKEEYELELTNLEIRIMFRRMVKGWFDGASSSYSDFIKALLLGDVKAMNTYMNRVTVETFSFFRKNNEPKSSSLDLGDCLRVSSEAADFDTGKGKSGEPERFYHGFVLGMMVELSDKYVLISNRESGFGRYDIMLEPRKRPGEAALLQTEEKNYQADLIAKGIPAERIRKYGFAFCGKKVLIGSV